MNISHKTEHDAKMTVSIILSEEETKQQMQNAITLLAKDTEVPGFRKGQAPQEMIVAKHGMETIYQSMVERLISKDIFNYLKEQNIRPLGQLETDLKNATPLELSITVHHEPSMKLKKLDSISAEVKPEKVKKSELQEVINNITERAATFEATKKAAKMGDELVVNFTAESEGKPFEGLTINDLPIRLTEGMIFNIEKELVGAKAGDKKHVSVKKVENSPFQQLEGKPLELDIVVGEVREKKTPKLTDEYVKETFKFDTIAAFEERIEADLAAQKEQQAKWEAFQKIKEGLIAIADFTLPENILESTYEEQVSLFKKRAEQEKLSLDAYFEVKGQKTEKALADLKKQIEEEYKEFFICEHLFRERNIEVNHDLIHQVMQQRYGKDFDHHSREHMDTEYQLKKEALYEQFIKTK